MLQFLFTVLFPLFAGWNLVTSPVSADPADLFEDTCVRSVWEYDTETADTPTWRAWFRGSPDAGPSLNVIREARAYWVYADSTCTVELENTATVTAASR